MSKQMNRRKYAGGLEMTYHVSITKMNVTMRWTTSGYMLWEAWDCIETNESCLFDKFPYRLSQVDIKNMNLAWDRKMEKEKIEQ